MEQIRRVAVLGGGESGYGAAVLAQEKGGRTVLIKKGGLTLTLEEGGRSAVLKKGGDTLTGF